MFTAKVCCTLISWYLLAQDSARTREHVSLCARAIYKVQDCRRIHQIEASMALRTHYDSPSWRRNPV